MATVETILRKIENWKLDGDDGAAIEIERSEDLSASDIRYLQERINQYQYYDAEFCEIKKDLIDDPNQAVERFRALTDEQIKRHYPEYENIRAAIERVMADQNRKRNLKFLEEAEALARNFQLWEEAEARITSVKFDIQDWALDPELREKINQVDNDIKIDAEAQRLLNEVDNALETQKPGNGISALNKLETLGKVDRGVLRDKRLLLERLDAHAQGRSSRDEREFNIDDILVVIDAAEFSQQSLLNTAEYRNLYNQTRHLTSLYLKGIPVIREKIEVDTLKIAQVEKDRQVEFERDSQSPNLARYDAQLKLLREAVAKNDQIIIDYEEKISKNNKALPGIDEQARQQIKLGIDNCLGLAERYLERGAITQAEYQINVAEHWGDPEKPRPNAVEDLLGLVEPTKEQQTLIENLNGLIADRREKRKDAINRMTKASSILALQRPELNDLKVAQQELNAAQSIDPFTPGLESLKDDVEDRILSYKIGVRASAELQIEHLCERGMFERAQAIYRDLSTQLGQDLDLSKLKDRIDRTCEQVDRSNSAQDQFETILALAQKNLEPVADEIEEAIQAWERDCFAADRRRIIQAKDRLKRYQNEIKQIRAWYAQANAALVSDGDLPETLTVIMTELNRSSQGDHPLIVKLSARFWLEMAKRHGQHGRALDYLQTALEFAEGLSDNTLATDIRTRIKAIQDQTEEGRRAQETEENLERYLRDDLPRAVDIINSIPQDDPLRKQVRIQKLIREANYKERQSRSETHYQSAMEKASSGDYAEALSLVEKALGELYSEKAFELKLKCTTEQKIENDYLKLFQSAFDLQALKSSALSTEQVKLLEVNNALAEDILKKTQISTKLRTTAEQYRSYFINWRQRVKNRLENGKIEIAGYIDQADYKSAHQLGQELEQVGLPSDLASILIEINNGIKASETVTKIVHDKMQLAEEMAREGHFSRALQQLQALDQDNSVSDNLRRIVGETLERLNQNRQIYGRAYNLVFGASSHELEELTDVLTNQANRFSEKTLDYGLDLPVARRLDQTFTLTIRNLKEIEIRDVDKVSKAVNQIYAIIRWWIRSVETTARQAVALKDYQKLSEDMNSLVNEGTCLLNELISELTVFSDYILKHQDSLKQFQANFTVMANVASNLLTIGDHSLMPRLTRWEEHKTDLREILDKKHVIEDEVKVDDLIEKVNRKEKVIVNNFKTWAIPIGIGLIIVLVLFLLSFYNSVIGPTYFPSPTVTPTVSLTPSITPSLTITPKPSETPIPTRTHTPTLTFTPTPQPIGAVVRFRGGIGIYEMARISERLGTLNQGETFNLLLYCQPNPSNKSEAWGLVRVPGTDQFGWIKMSEDENGYNPVDLDINGKRPVQIMLSLHPELLIECPGLYTPIPYNP